MGRERHVSIVLDEGRDCDEYISGEIVDEQEMTSEVTPEGEAPYLITKITVVGYRKQYNPNYGDNKLCKCGHTYYRHFDSWEGMMPVGCKYCGCDEFVLAEDAND